MVGWLVDRLGPGLWDGMGGVNVGGIEAALRMLGVPEECRPPLFERILRFAGERLKDRATATEE